AAAAYFDHHLVGAGRRIGQRLDLQRRQQLREYGGFHVIPPPLALVAGECACALRGGNIGRCGHCSMEGCPVNHADGTLHTSRRKMLQAATALALALPLARAGIGAQAASAKPKIGIIGSGNVGSNLGRVWARAGYPVMFSSLDIAADRRLAASVGANASAGTPQQAAAFGEVLLLAAPYGAQQSLGRDLGTALRDKV